MDDQCPLITHYTTELGIDPALLETLYLVRKWDVENVSIPFKWPALLRTKIFDIDKKVETDEPVILHPYQLQQIHHMSRMPKFINGDGVGLGKTIDTIAAACWLKQKNPHLKIVIICTKSTKLQWVDEFHRFSYLKVKQISDPPYRKGVKPVDTRYAKMIEFFEGDADVLVVRYTSMTGTRKRLTGKFDEDGLPVEGGKERISEDIKKFSVIFKEHKDRIVLVLDESQKFKGLGTQIRTLVFNLSKYAQKVWTLTATVIKNDLREFYSICTAIRLNPFGSMWDFDQIFCLWYEQFIGAGRPKKKVLRGYQNVKEFKEGIRPFFLGRSQSQVKAKLPRLSTTYHPIDLDEKQTRLLLEDIPSGKFQLPPALIKVDGFWHEKERDPDNLMTLLSVQQLVANHWALLDKTDEKTYHTKILSPKEECLLDMLDGDMQGEKVIVFTKFKTWIDRLEWITANGHFTNRKFLRITGDESEKKRNENKKLFQNPNSGYDVIFINSAGIEGINLQQAAHMIALDLPWSWGDLIQLVGRMVRMASPHSACTLHVIVARGTVDEYTIETLKGKKGLFEIILGASHSAGILDDGSFVDLESGMEQVGSDEEFQKLLKAHIKKTGIKVFLGGSALTEAQADKNYEMIFEKKPKKKKRPVTDEDSI